jgi:dTMP kinase
VTFIVLEGGEASGKSTQARRLAQWLHDRGHEVVSTFEPGDTKLGAQIRVVLLHGDEPLDARTELFLLLADRAQHVADVIRPALARGAVVVSDRFAPSSLAYQGVGRELGVEAVERMNTVATGGLQPDIVVVIDVPDEVAEIRAASEPDRVERAGAEFHARVRAAYRELAPARGWHVVDGRGSPDDVALRVQDAVAAVLP